LSQVGYKGFMVQRSKTSTTPASRLNPTYKLPVAIRLCRFDKADGPAAVYTGGLYGLFSRSLAERPFPQSLALQTFLSFFVSFFLSFLLGQTNKNQSERLNCPEAPGARMIIADVLKHPAPNPGRPAKPHIQTSSSYSIVPVR
jgi:hypothetical protein